MATPPPNHPTSTQAYAAWAERCLDPQVWHYLQDGANTGNEAALAAVPLMPRPLARVQGGHTRLNLFGQALAHPLLLAPVAYQTLFHADGEVGSAMAAAAQGGQMVISSLASQPLEDIVQGCVAQSGDTKAAGPWFQLYWQGDRGRTALLLQRAVAAGCSAIVFTVDAPIKRATLQLPAHVQAVNLPAAAPMPTLTEDQSAVFDGWMAQAPDWDDLQWLRTQTDLPLVLKGVLHPDDAERAITLGVDGLVVSNHGGRVLEGAPLSLHALPAVVTCVQGRVPVLFDSGIRSGRDAFVALQHGATAVLVGRPCMWGLAGQGALGVAHVIRILRDELEMTMALTACATLADIPRSAAAIPRP